MTKKDYIKLAAALHNVKPTEDQWLRFQQWQADVAVVTNVLAGDNGAFDRERFLRAAGAL